jgi:hypothetical protein
LSSQQGHFIPSQAPTMNHCQSLKHHAITLQCCTQRLCTPRSSLKPTFGTVQKGEMLTKRRKYTRQCKAPPKYCPASTSCCFSKCLYASSVDTATNKGSLLDYYPSLPCSCNNPSNGSSSPCTNAQFAWTFSSRFNLSGYLGLWCKYLISPEPKDFNNTLQKPVKGIGCGLHIKGQGEVTWAFHDVNGNLRT